MTDYTSGDHVYFNNIIENPKKYLIGFILNQRHDMYITSSLGIMEENIVSFLELFVSKMIEPWMNANIQIVAQL